MNEILSTDNYGSMDLEDVKVEIFLWAYGLCRGDEYRWSVQLYCDRCMVARYMNPMKALASMDDWCRHHSLPQAITRLSVTYMDNVLTNTFDLPSQANGAACLLS